MSAATLRICEDVELPLETVTQTIGILAKRRVGKSYLARRIAEQLIKALQQVIVVDPKGDWWGIRSAADGKGEGIKIAILGGGHGDVPLEAGNGAMVAKLAAEDRVSMLIDLSLFSREDRALFMADFLETLYRLKAHEAFRTPVMLILDEADEIAPQVPLKGDEVRMTIGAIDVVKRGGQRGLGCMVVTQRSASLNKNVLTQVELLIMLRTISPQDLDAVNLWVAVHGSRANQNLLMESLPSLPIGEAWFWSPGWPTDAGLLIRRKVLPIQTFDSGATPKPGEQRREPKMMADIDLGAFSARLAATIEKAKQDDPRELRKQVAALKLENQELRARPAKGPSATVAEVKIKEVPVVQEKDWKRLEKVSANLVGGIATLQGVVNGLLKELQKSHGSSVAVVRPPAPVPAALPRAPDHDRALPDRRAPAPRSTPRPPAPAVSAADGDALGPLSKCARALLLATAQLRSVGPATKTQIAVLSGYRLGVSTFRLGIKELSNHGFVLDHGDRVEVTATGLTEAGNVPPMPKGEGMLAFWQARLGKTPRAMLEFIVAAYPREVSPAELSEATQCDLEKSTFRLAVKELTNHQVITGSDKTALRASDLFAPTRGRRRTA